MTATHLALLRGINLGRAKRIAMADLRTLLGDLGYAEVRTLLNSGNAVFAIPGTGSTRRGDPAVRIESALLERLGGSVRVTVLAAAELAALLERNPLRSAASAEPSRCLIAVPRNPADLDRLKSLAGRIGPPRHSPSARGRRIFIVRAGSSRAAWQRSSTARSATASRRAMRPP